MPGGPPSGSDLVTDATRPAPRRPFRVPRGLALLAFQVPALFFIGLWTYYPMLSGAQMAFRRWSLYDINNTPWIGFGNFESLMSNPNWDTIIGNTAIWVVGSIVPQFLIGFTLALALWRAFRGRAIYQAFVFVPWAISGFRIGILFRWMFNAEFGVINDLLRITGITETKVPWLADPTLARISVIIANIWYGVTFFAIMILAALQSVDEEMLEAGEVDGAGRLRSLFQLVIPSIRYTLMLTVLLRVVWIYNFPDIIYGMTGGGPANQTHIVTTWLITLTQQGEFGQGAALGLMSMLILAMFAVFYLLALKER